MARKLPKTQPVLKSKESKEALTFFYVAIKKLTVEIHLMKSDIQALRNTIEHSMLVKNNQILTSAFIKKYNFVIIQSAEEFKRFDSELQTNDEFAKDFKDALEFLIGSNMKQSIIAVVKKFLRRDFAMKCTAIKLSKDKFVLKNTHFYNSLFDLICRYHKNLDGGIITEKMFYQSLSSCLTNAKDWDGYRKFRQSATIQDETLFCSLFLFVFIFFFEIFAKIFSYIFFY